MSSPTSASNSLANRTALITGATAGIGTAIARAFVARGAACILNGRRAEALRDLCRDLGSHARPVAGDCADDAVIAAMFAAAPPSAPVDLVVVNAGRGLAGSVLTSDPAQWEEMLRTNVIGAAKLIRAAGEHMLRAVGARTGAAALDRPRDIIVIGSTVGRHISPFSSMYGSTKFAANSLAEAARRELGPRGIRVTLIEPGFVETEFQGVAGYDPKWFEEVKARIGPPLTPADVADAVAYTAALPPAVHVSDIVIRPTRQDYP